MKTLKIIVVSLLSLMAVEVFSQSKGMIETSKSPEVKVRSLGMDEVVWTDGFWGEQFDLARKVTIPTLWDSMLKRTFDNFKIAAGHLEGEFLGTRWQDGDFYKWVEALVATYSVTKDGALLKRIDQIADTIALAADKDGYINTKNQIGKGILHAVVFGSGSKYNSNKRWVAEQDHELYNMGHLITLGCLHYRVTGSDKLLKVAKNAANHLYNKFKEPSKELSEINFNPTQIIALVELYRTTGDRKYLTLAEIFTDMRGMGNQVNFQNHKLIRDASLAEGHAVCATYLYMGVLDIYAETGDRKLFDAINRIWNDAFLQKVSITGGHGNLHNGVSPTNGSSIHEAYAPPYELRNSTAYNETCANYGGGFWNYRMFTLTGDPKYLDFMEEVFYNNFSSIGVEGDSYFYTNPLRWYGKDHPLLTRDYHERFKTRGGICCPASIVRFMCEANNYACGKDDRALWILMYGSNKINTKIGKNNVAFVQQTDYPWNGKVKMTYNGDNNADFTLKLRIPAWAKGSTLKVNGSSQKVSEGSFADIKRIWKKGDVVELDMPLKARLVEAHYRVEEARGQAAVKYGPLTYSLESADLPEGVSVFDVIIPVSNDLKPVFEKNLLGGVVSLNGKGYVQENRWKQEDLYHEIVSPKLKEIQIKMIPYFRWANRGEGEMTVFLPVKWN